MFSVGSADIVRAGGCGDAAAVKLTEVAIAARR
jgi:hypothetical protein